MKVFWLIFIAFVASIIFINHGFADFLPHNRPAYDFEAGKVDETYVLTYRSWVPIQAIGGHVDVQTSERSFIGKVEGGYGLGHHLSLRGYTQYRSEWVDAGGNLEYRLHKPGLHIHSGVGIWTENSRETQAFGTRAYVHIRVKHRLTINTDILFSDDFREYRVYSRPVIDIPITEHFAVLVSGAIEYEDTVDWYLKYGIRWRW